MTILDIHRNSVDQGQRTDGYRTDGYRADTGHPSGPSAAIEILDTHGHPLLSAEELLRAACRPGTHSGSQVSKTESGHPHRKPTESRLSRPVKTILRSAWALAEIPLLGG